MCVSNPQNFTTAASLWRHFVDEGVLKPLSYDKDIVTLIENQLPGNGDIPSRMESAEWTARDFIRAISLVTESFFCLMKDLLSLYSDISAKHANNENIKISYEFEEGDKFDQSLIDFKEAIATLNNVKQARGEFILPEVGWDYPAVSKNKTDAGKIQRLRSGGEKEWNFTLPMPPGTVNPTLARGISLVYSVLSEACNFLRSYGATMQSVGKVRHDGSLETNEKTKLSVLYYDFTDYFPEYIITKLREDIDILEKASLDRVQDWIAKVEEWSSSFWVVSMHDAQSALESVLSLPMWGKRHELYSSWVVCVVAEAFKEQNIKFEVSNNTLSFPFKAKKIASFQDDIGTVEFWSEVRSPTTVSLTQGRKRGVQPDYRFIRRQRNHSVTEFAVEVKHYRRAAAARHGDTAADYARALVPAQVAIVAHGQIGDTAINRVDEPDRSRVSFHENIRSLYSIETKNLINKFQEVFPNSIRIHEIKVVSSRVDRLEIILQVNIPGEGEEGIVLASGSHLVDLDKFSNVEVYLLIVCHPDRSHTIENAEPCVHFLLENGKSAFLINEESNPTRSRYLGNLKFGNLSKPPQVIFGPARRDY